ncbi:MAG: iron ABC transporter permease [Zoogloeaceae bacterium]|jgi:iron(III) transport system permease protein|nr:iron ABC transporter permease [Zoogloeaceae bacterium]
MGAFSGFRAFVPVLSILPAPHALPGSRPPAGKRTRLRRLTGDVGRGGLLACLVSALLVALPVIALVMIAGTGSGDLWPHLAAYVLPQALLDSLILLLGVGALTITLGSAAAWLVTACDFPGRRLLDWALLLPLAVPAYIIAYAWLDLWHPVGMPQTMLRELLGYDNPRDLRLPDIRSMGGCILVLGLALYPYVYLPARAAFRTQAAELMEAARLLGSGPWRCFFRVALPLARPAIAAGASLALMETLNDIGAAEFLGVRTLTVAIYSTWNNRSSLAGAAQIALFMLGIVLTLLFAERWARRHRHYAASARQNRRLARARLSGWAGWLACALASLPVALGFLLPVGYLVVEAGKRVRFDGIDPAIWIEVGNTCKVSALATLFVTALAFMLVNVQRRADRPLTRGLARVAGMGYAIPGVVLALGMMAFVGALDNALSAALERGFGLSVGLLLTGTSFMLVYACVARFLAVGVGGIEAGFCRIPHSIDDAARVLGAGAWRVAARVHLPLGWQAIAAAMLLAFVDCAKELPATLLLRPMNFETLATHLYGEAARGTYESAAIAALLIVLVGLPPVILLSRQGNDAPSAAARAPLDGKAA